MAARIRSLKNALVPIDDASRDDLIVTDTVTVTAITAATTYAWSLVFIPEGSSAIFSGSPTAISPGTFTIDLPGSYLVRLVVDASLITQSEQYVRLRALTPSLGLKLIAAGERRDATAVIPVDIDPEGWANEQNFNLQTLEDAISNRSFTSGEAILAGDVVGFDVTAGGARVVKSIATVGTPVGKNFVSGIALDAAGAAGTSIRVMVAVGFLADVIFDAAPVAADQGKEVFLHTVSGQVSLTAPVASGTKVVRVGVLQTATTQTIQFMPQVIGLNP